MKYIVANWKSNKTSIEVKEWLEAVRKANVGPPSATEIILCPSFLHLALIKKELEIQPLAFSLKLGAQNLSPYPEGTYTGEVAARMLAEWIEYVILGHSERRQYFKETNHEIKLKVAQALKYNLIPIVAFSELSQVETAAQGLEEKVLEKILFMYEPPEAISRQEGPIGVGQAAPLEQILTMIRKVKELMPQNQVLYGGSVKSDNLALYWQEPEIDGVVAGTASLNPEEFIKMITHAKTQT